MVENNRGQTQVRFAGIGFHPRKTRKDTEHDSQIPSVTGLNFSPKSKNNLLIASKKLVAKSAQTGHRVGGAYLWFENPEGLFLQPLPCRPNGRFRAFRGFKGDKGRGRSKNRESPDLALVVG